MNEKTLNWLCRRLKIKPEEFFALQIYDPKPKVFGDKEITSFSFVRYPSYKKRIIFMDRAGKKKMKVLYIPSPELKKIQRALLREILAPFVKLFQKRQGYDIFQCAHGGIAGRSIISNLLPHLKNRFFFITDIHNAYYSTPSYYIEGGLKKLGFYPDVVQTILHLTTKKGLIIGPPTSPFLFNLTLAHLLDEPILAYLKIAEKDYGLPPLVYTRYFDDIIISSKEKIPQDIINAITWHIQTYYRLQKNKTHCIDIRHHAPIEITGLTLTSYGLKLPKRKRKNMEVLLHMGIHNPEKFYPIIMGKLGQFKQIYEGWNLPPRIDKLLEKFELAYAEAKTP